MHVKLLKWYGNVVCFPRSPWNFLCQWEIITIQWFDDYYTFDT